MSLDVWLSGKPEKVDCRCECGHEHTRWQSETLFMSNITHNLNKMATAAGIYEAVWRPEEIGIKKAAQLIEPLRKGIITLKERPTWFKTFEPENKWGTYDNFLPWLKEYLAACERYPEAKVTVSR